jgi:membrane protease YdiL (CAAX protease family)
MVMVIGFIILQQIGVAPIGMLTKSWSIHEPTILISIVAGVITLFASLFIISRHPQVNHRITIEKMNGTSKRKIGFVWILYLICYESYLRIFLFNTLPNIPGIRIILLNVIVYAVLHLHRAKSEVLATIPFGFFICCCTFISGSVWPAFVAHAVLAWVTHLGLWPSSNRIVFSNKFLFTHAQKRTT